MIRSVGPQQLGGRGEFDPTPRLRGAQEPLRKAHGSAICSQKPVKRVRLIVMNFALSRGSEGRRGEGCCCGCVFPTFSTRHRCVIPAKAGMTCVSPFHASTMKFPRTAVRKHGNALQQRSWSMTAGQD
jgi:hypothetical protein